MNNKKYWAHIITITIIITALKVTNHTFAQTVTGKDWIKVCDTSSFSPRSMHQVVAFNDKLFLIDGRDNTGNINDVWCSDNGINWSLVKNKIGVPIDYGSSVVVFNNMLWMNSNQDIWSSSDGNEWNKVATVNQLPRYGKSMVVFDNKIWLIGGWDNGFKNDVWSSPDGVNWSKLKTVNSFSIRADHSIVVHDSRMWLIAGQDGPNNSDVWCSSDGIDWKFISNAPFTPRHSSQVVVCNGKMWVVAGFAMDNTGRPIRLSDVWASSDGKVWEEVISSAPFNGRQEHQVVVFKNRIWLIGGLTGDYSETDRIYKNDIWYTEASLTDVESKSIPRTSSLLQNYPNPFNPVTVISYQLSAFSHATLKVYDIIGNEVVTLVDEEKPAGKYEVKFSTETLGHGSSLSSNVYLYKIKAGNLIQTRKMILIK